MVNKIYFLTTHLALAERLPHELHHLHLNYLSFHYIFYVE